MSNPGFYSDIYQQIRTYADLVDKVLIALKDDARTSDPSRESLAQILDSFAVDEQEDLSVRIIVLMLGGNNKANREKWLSLSAALRGGKSDRSLIEDLELLAHTLEQQQADALAKMRGWSH
jgi:hypothetical protein